MKHNQTPRLLIVGASETGKSLLSKSIARELEKRGYAVTVYDPVLSEWTNEATVTANAEEFFLDLADKYDDGQKQAVFIDEADTLLNIGMRENHWIMTRGRHYLLSPHVITQRPALVAPTVRGMCNELYCFRTSKADAKLLSEDFSHEGLLAAPDLMQGEFLHCYWKDKIKTLDKSRIF
jgi:hypothetical protein